MEHCGEMKNEEGLDHKNFYRREISNQSNYGL